MWWLASASACFIVIAAIINHEALFSGRGLAGVIAGAAAALAYCSDSKARMIFGVLGVGLLIVTAIGGANDITLDARAFFGGMSVGLIIGLILALFVFRQRSSEWLSNLAELEDEEWLRRLSRWLAVSKTE